MTLSSTMRADYTAATMWLSNNNNNGKPMVMMRGSTGKERTFVWCSLLGTLAIGWLRLVFVTLVSCFYG